jgi:hypothetical protein
MFDVRLALAALLTVGVASAQSTDASLSGAVLDSSRAAVAEADVTSRILVRAWYRKRQRIFLVRTRFQHCHPVFIDSQLKSRVSAKHR